MPSSCVNSCYARSRAARHPTRPYGLVGLLWFNSLVGLLRTCEFHGLDYRLTVYVLCRITDGQWAMVVYIFILYENKRGFFIKRHQENNKIHSKNTSLLLHSFYYTDLRLHLQIITLAFYLL